MTTLDGKVALITGASRGIGRGIALCMARAGADIVVNYRSHPDEAQQVADAIVGLGRRAFLVQADVSDRGAMERMFAAALERFGHLDIAVANAASEIVEPTLTARWDNVLRVIEVTQFGVFHTCQLAAQQMVRQVQAGQQVGRSGGKIIIIGSVHAEIAPPADVAYNMAKAAVNHLGNTLAVELAPHHINVNTINPGWIDTPGEREMFGDPAVAEGGSRVPWGRLGTPEDIGEVAAFLASDAADYITGASLRVDGGFVLGLRAPESEGG